MNFKEFSFSFPFNLISSHLKVTKCVIYFLGTLFLGIKLASSKIALAGEAPLGIGV